MNASDDWRSLLTGSIAMPTCSQLLFFGNLYIVRVGQCEKCNMCVPYLHLDEHRHRLQQLPLIIIWDSRRKSGGHELIFRIAGIPPLTSGLPKEQVRTETKTTTDGNGRMSCLCNSSLVMTRNWAHQLTVYVADTSTPTLR